MMRGEVEPVVAFMFCCWYCASVDLQVSEWDGEHTAQHNAEAAMRGRGWLRKKKTGWVCPTHARQARRKVFSP